MEILEKINDLNNLILTGKLLDGFDKYYHSDVEMQENDAEPRLGKAANREYEVAFVGMVEEWHGAEVKSVAVGENVSTVEWMMDMTLKGMGRMKREQVAVQRWKDGQIINEKFYYKS